MRRSSQYGRHPEVNQAVVDSVSRSCLKSRAAESVTFLVCIKNGCRHPTRRGPIPVDVCVDKNVAFLHLYKCYRAWIFRLFNLLFETRHSSPVRHHYGWRQGVDQILESLSRRRFCQHGRQPEVNRAVIDGE